MVNPVVIGPCELWLGDCRDILPTLPKVDAVVTDPPWKLSDGQVEIRGTGVAPCRQRSMTLKRGAVGEFDSGLICEILEKCDGDAFFLAGYKELGELARICLPLRGIFAWHKPNGPPAAFYPAKLDLSFIVWTGKKSALYGFQHWPSMVFSVPFPPAGCFSSEREVDHTSKATHPCQGPIKLYQQLIRPLPDRQAIFDPFMGSGTTGVACINLGRRFIGIEIEERYFTIACRRIEDALRQMPLFPTKEVAWPKTPRLPGV